ncbi:hypothetical protein BGX31_006859 [Mortierella sp. GBA43]|nr:hypothetical protein BGX31_006859 [Mortierella sp. GBA43]
MSSAVAPPASFGLVSGTAFASASPEALARMFDTLDVASLEQEHSRLHQAIKQLEQSNKEIGEFIEQEQQEFKEHNEQQRIARGDTSSDDISLVADPEFVLAIEENKVVIAKYEKTCAELKKAIQRKGGSLGCAPLAEGAASTEITAGETGNDGVYL